MSLGLTLLSRWNSLVQAAPNERALVEGTTGRVFSRAELNRRSEALTSSLPADDQLAQRRVAFSQSNGADWLALFLSLLRAGAVPLPIDGSEPAAAQRQIAAAAGAALLWHEGHLESLAEALEPVREEGVALVKLTSGSTGAPRAIPFTHEEMIADGRQICATMDLRPTDLNYALIPLGHSYGLGNLVVPLLIQGTPLLCASSPLPQAIAGDLARWNPTVFPLVPALLRALSLADVSPSALQSLRVIISAGAALPAEIAQGFQAKFGKTIHGFYGSSETGGIAYDRSGDATLEGRAVGTPLEGVRIVADAGERIKIASAAVFSRGNPDRLEGFPAYSPADRAAFNERGELVLLGRIGRMVKIAGRRLDLAELEQTFRRLPGIRDAYICTHPDARDELATVVASDLSAAEIRALFRRDLAPWKCPKRILVIPEFPLTPRGKTDTRALQERIEAG